MKQLISKLNDEVFSGLPSHVKDKLSEKTQKLRLQVELSGEELKIDFYSKEDNSLVVYSWFYLNANSLEVGYIDVAEDYQRQGIASLIYNLAESITGLTISETDQQTSDGKNFRSNRKS